MIVLQRAIKRSARTDIQCSVQCSTIFSLKTKDLLPIEGMYYTAAALDLTEPDMMITEDRIQHPNGSVGKDDISLALNKILSSSPFRNSKQCSGLLRYIVEHTLSGEENLLRERVIGAELFGRPADYETSEDPVVRLRVSEVRKRLAQYYLSDRDHRSVQIEIPSGSYRATFHWNVEESLEVIAEESGETHTELVAEMEPFLPPVHAIGYEVITADHAATLRPERRFKGAVRLAVVAVALCLLFVAGAFTFLRANPAETAFRAFWTPWVSGPKPVIISIGSNAVYRFRFEYLDRYAEQHGLKSAGQEFFVPFEHGATISADDLYPATKSFVALGDVAAVSRIVATLTQAKKPYQERFPNDVSFAELRDSPSVLVGGFNNAMTIDLTKQLEFVMRGGNQIIDTQDPKRKWELNVLEDPPDTADYAIVTRLVQRGGDAPLISVAGLGQYGTLASAELICNPANLHMITDKLPKDWAEKNFQAVLRIGIVDYKPTASEVVAFKSW